MKTSEFLKVAEKLTKTGVVSVAKKGQHANLGGSCIG